MSVIGALDRYSLPSSGLDAGGEAGASISAYAKIYHLARLPGHGEKPSYCQNAQDARWLVCNACETGRHGFQALRQCITRDCPSCYEKWAFKEANIAAWRLWSGARYVAREIARRYFRIQHYVISFKVDDEYETLQSFRTRAYGILRKHGVDGGLMVWHPFRQDRLSGQFKYDGTVHFHILGVAYGSVLKPTEGQGYVFKVVEDKEFSDYRGFRSPGAVKRALGYLLSHCGVLDGRHSVTWFGVLSYNKLALQKLKDAYPEGYEAITAKRGSKCPYCGSEDTEPMDSWVMDDHMGQRWYRRRSRDLLGGFGAFVRLEASPESSCSRVVNVEDYEHML